MGNNGSAPTPASQGDVHKDQQTHGTKTFVSSDKQTAGDTKLSDEPLYVLYGAPSCIFCVKAADLLLAKQKHHCKIGTDLLKEAVEGSGIQFSGTIPQIFACPSAELLLDVAGKEPGSLGATAHGAVTTKMCSHVGGYTDLLKAITAVNPEK